MMATLMWLLLNELSQKLIKAHFDILAYCSFTGTMVLGRENVTEYTNFFGMTPLSQSEDSAIATCSFFFVFVLFLISP